MRAFQQPVDHSLVSQIQFIGIIYERIDFSNRWWKSGQVDANSADQGRTIGTLGRLQIAVFKFPNGKRIDRVINLTGRIDLRNFWANGRNVSPMLFVFGSLLNPSSQRFDVRGRESLLL
jgi:hypothetical protein